MKKYIFLILIILNFVYSFSQTVSSFEEAQKLALATNKLIAVDFTAVWCGPCRKMDNDVWSNEEVIKVTKNFVFAKIDLDSNRSLAQKFNVNAIPNILIVDGNGSILEQNIGYIDRQQTIDFFKLYQLSTEFFMNEAINYYKNQNYNTALRLALKIFDYSMYIEDKNVNSKFVYLADKYLSEASSLNDKKSKNYEDNKQLLEVLELSKYAYTSNYEKLHKKIVKIDYDSINSSFGKKQYKFYQYLLCLNVNTQDDFLKNNKIEGFEVLKSKAELIFNKKF